MLLFHIRIIESSKVWWGVILKITAVKSEPCSTSKHDHIIDIRVSSFSIISYDIKCTRKTELLALTTYCLMLRRMFLHLPRPRNQCNCALGPYRISDPGLHRKLDGKQQACALSVEVHWHLDLVGGLKRFPGPAEGCLGENGGDNIGLVNVKTPSVRIPGCTLQ